MIEAYLGARRLIAARGRARSRVSYGGIGAVHEVSLAVAPGQIATVIGPNGAGKTTLLNAIMGVHAGTRRGAVRRRRIIGRLDVEARVRRGHVPGAGEARAVRRP